MHGKATDLIARLMQEVVDGNVAELQHRAAVDLKERATKRTKKAKHAGCKGVQMQRQARVS